MVDIALFLDTHPCDKEALETYQHYKSMLKDARSEYTECYGPLLKTDVNCENYWTWIERPWPWE
ncbi:polypeptide composition of the spore coat protein CotJB [Lachnospiraceae bacterium KM106-2]|nr:polypeptide composition of the spore coat protein CotJB [Lachnospiraceae bacterium KM106-2]